MGILRDRMIEEMKLRNFSPATQASYVYAVSRLTQYHRNRRISSIRRTFGLIFYISPWNGSYRRTP